jgi:hypothetical protein
VVCTVQGLKCKKKSAMYRTVLSTVVGLTGVSGLLAVHLVDTTELQPGIDGVRILCHNMAAINVLATHKNLKFAARINHVRSTVVGPNGQTGVRAVNLVELEFISAEESATVLNLNTKDYHVWVKMWK